jgi:hypothetical protein
MGFPKHDHFFKLSLFTKPVKKLGTDIALAPYAEPKPAKDRNKMVEQRTEG